MPSLRRSTVGERPFGITGTSLSRGKSTPVTNVSNVDYSGLSKLRFRLSVWSTGDWWFLACQPRPGRAGGWLFKHELRGELDDRAAEAFAKSFGDSLLVSYWSPDEQLAKLQELWHVSRRSGEA